MTDRRRNFAIIFLVLVLLAGAVYTIIERPTRLGLDLRGGVELVYEARPTPRVPTVTPEAVDDAIQTIRRRTDALGVAEPEIQQASNNQISVALPSVENAQRAVEQVGETAQLRFYDWEPNIIGSDGNSIPNLYEAAGIASQAEPRAEAEDVPPGGAAPEIRERFNNNREQIREYYDRRNDSTEEDRLYLFAPSEDDFRDLIAGPAPSCEQLLADFEVPAGTEPGEREVGEDTECRADLRELGAAGPPEGSTVIRVPRGITLLRDEPAPNAPPNVEVDRWWVVEDDVELSGDDIRNPEQNFDQQTQEPIVTMEFTEEGQRSFQAVTQRIAERGLEQIRPPGLPPEQTFQRFAISLDEQIVSIATIDYQENPEGIDGRTGAQINGIGGLQQAQDLAESLRIGALAVDLELISQTQVSATLGQQALDQGLLAAGAGLALTLLFLLVFYRVLGAVAGTALLVYAVLLFAVVKLIPITLTLPGIAGLILTLGVAADANIVIFERIKEEARAGLSIPKAITTGYARALRTIVDANVVILGVAFILFMLATAGVRGFAFTLLVGTLISLFTAVLATSAILGSMARTRLLGSRHALGAGPERASWRFDFMGRSKWFFSASGVILAVGAIAIAGLGINFGIDFESGTRIRTPLERPATVNDVRDTLPGDLQDAEIQRVEDPELGTNLIQISTSTLGPNEVAEVRDALDESFGVQQADFTSTSVGPTFGAQIAQTAVIAILASLLLISIYIGLRFEFKFAVPVLIALTHDLLITAAIYSIFGREVTASTVAALLTILGYSLYDTIIVFDRIRENVPRMPRATFAQIVNRSMSETLTRSLATSVSTLLPVTALMLFGGETLQDFGFALLVGVMSGTYSSIFIASPVLTAWKEREPAYRRRHQLALEDHDGHVPAFAETGSDADQRRRARTTRPAPAEPVGARVADGDPAGRNGETERAVPVAPAGPPVRRNGPARGDGDGTPAARTGGARAASSPRPAGAEDAGGDEAREAAEEEARRVASANRRRKKHGRR